VQPGGQVDRLLAGDLTIGDFPRGDTPPAQLAAYYAAHHTTVALGGTLLACGAVFLAVFGAALWARLHGGGNRLAAGIVLLGTALTAAAGIQSAGTYTLFGDFGANPVLTPAALQSWHLAGAEFGVGADLLVLLLGVFVASVTGRVVPAWQGWTGLAIGIAQFTPVGFLASLVFLLWAAIAGITLAVRPPAPAPAPTTAIPLPA
jgi:hypothetical protein